MQWGAHALSATGVATIALGEVSRLALTGATPITVFFVFCRGSLLRASGFRLAGPDRFYLLAGRGEAPEPGHPRHPLVNHPLTHRHAWVWPVPRLFTRVLVCSRGNGTRFPDWVGFTSTS